MQLRLLLDDTKYWIENKTFPEDEIALRFSHRLVKIHLFPNGNGRHSRLIADILINKGFGKDEFTWGSINLTHMGNVRTTYLNALKKADEGDYKDLLNFAQINISLFVYFCLTRMLKFSPEGKNIRCYFRL